jgi:hypothetical protein
VEAADVFKDILNVSIAIEHLLVSKIFKSNQNSRLISNIVMAAVQFMLLY